jgi:hypothetical protein
VVNEALFNESDTRMLASYGLVPVTTILATANWGNPYMFEELRRRAPWRLGGWEAVDRSLYDQETKDELDKRAKTDEHLTSLSKDAWKMYNKKIGLRSQMYSPTVKRKGQPAQPLKPDQRTSQTRNPQQAGAVNGSQRLIITP